MSGATTRHIILLRHARPKPADVADAERALGERGFAEARQAGEWLATSGLVPDLALVSAALRARQTWAAAAEQLGHSVPDRVEEALYTEGLDGGLELLRGLDPAVATVIVVGHNPASERLALSLDDGTGPDEVRSRLQEKFPSGALAVLEVKVAQWADVGHDTARLIHFVVPGPPAAHK